MNFVFQKVCDAHFVFIPVPLALASDISQNNLPSLFQRSIQHPVPSSGCGGGNKDEAKKSRSLGVRHSDHASSTITTLTSMVPSSAFPARGVLQCKKCNITAHFLSLASIFAIPIFPLPKRHSKKLYAIALDLAKELGMRDSYTLFHRNAETLTKLWASEQEKSWLSSLGLIASNIRHRDISLVDMDQAITKYAVNLAKPGISSSRLEHFIENPVISDILTAAEFESMNSHGLIPEGYTPPSFQPEPPKEHQSPIAADALPPSKKLKVSHTMPNDHDHRHHHPPSASSAEHFFEPAPSPLLNRAILEASNYNRWLAMYRRGMSASKNS